MMEIHGDLDLTGIPEDQFDPEMELRAAVVREGAVLGSTVLKAGNTKKRLPFAVQFEPPILPGARLPCPVRLVIGPNLADAELLSLDTLSIDVDLTAPDKPGGPGARLAEAKLSAGTLALNPE